MTSHAEPATREHPPLPLLRTACRCHYRPLANAAPVARSSLKANSFLQDDAVSKSLPLLDTQRGSTPFASQACLYKGGNPTSCPYLSPPSAFAGNIAATVLCFATAVDRSSHIPPFLMCRSKTTAAPWGSSPTHRTCTFFGGKPCRHCSNSAAAARCR
jgi:hypothetical protein